MAIEILLAPAHWPEELAKVTKAFAHKPNAVVVPVGFRTISAPHFEISPKTGDKLDAAAGKVFTAKVVQIERYPDEAALRTRVYEVLGEGKRGSDGFEVIRKAALRAGTQTVDGDTWQRLAQACTPDLKVSHVRWFGHGFPGRIRGEDGHNVDLYELARIIDFTETAIVTLYCCETGKLNAVKRPTEFHQPDAPAYILGCLKERAAAIGPLVINSCTTTNMWVAAHHVEPEYLFERHTFMGLGGAIIDVETGKECEVLMEKRETSRKWARLAKRVVREANRKAARDEWESYQ